MAVLDPRSTGYSSHVCLRLHVDDVEYDVAQVGPDYLIVRGGVVVEPGAMGTLVVEVDGRPERHELCFPNGIGGEERAKCF